MAEYYIFPDPSPVCAGFPNINVYEIEVNLSQADSQSKYIIVPADVQEVVVTLEPLEGSTATVFTTTDLVEKVKNNNPDITWIEWTSGVVDFPIQDACSKVTALRIDQLLEGSVKATIRMQ